MQRPYRIKFAALIAVFALILGTTLFAKSKQKVLGYTSYGSGPEKVLVLHSWMGTGRSFDAARPYLDTKSFTYVFADVRGYGRSLKIRGAYNSREISADAFRLADELGWKRFHVVAHSMNGMAVQRMALDDWTSGRKRIKSIVAVTPVIASGYPADAKTAEFLQNLIHNRKLTMAGFSGLTGGKLNATWAVLKTNQHLATSRPDAMRGYYDMWLGEDFSDALKKAQPGMAVRVIGGRNDLPGFQEPVLRRGFTGLFPRLDFRFVTDAGHFPMEETPALFAKLVEEHLNANR